MDVREQTLGQLRDLIRPPKRRSRSTATERLAPEDDWRNIDDLAEKKKAQNRIAQRVYRRNVKRRINELEQKVAAQAMLLAQPAERAPPQSEPTTAISPRPSQPNGSPDVRFNDDLMLPFSDQAFDMYRPRTSHMPAFLSAPETDSLLSPGRSPTRGERDSCQSTARAGGSTKLSNGIDFYHNMCDDGTVAVPFPTPESSTSNLDPSSGDSSSTKSQSSLSPVPPPPLPLQSPQSQPQSADPTSPPPAPPASVSVEDRLNYVLRCAQSVGFDSLDAALAAYYTTRFDADGGAQRAARIRRLPALLEALRAAADEWPRWEARGYRDGVVRSAERVLDAEVREMRERGRLKSGGGDDEGDWDRVMSQVQDAAPNLWSVITTLLHGPANNLCPDYSSRLVRIIALLCG